jgi:photosystem II stability/assembly factor-like uncharacterized protein
MCRRLFMAGLLLVSIAALVILSGHAPAKPLWRQRAVERGRRGPFPSDWFMQQRVWPDAQIEMADYRAAVDAADRVRGRSTRDQMPPWTPVGPTNIGGRVADIVAHPHNPQVFYVAAASGGIFKTTDGGLSWTAVFDQSPSLSMGALAMDPAHPDTLYAGTGEACSAGYSYFGTGIYRTINGGLTWQPRGLSNSRYIARIVLDPEDPQRIWVAAMGELYATSSERGIYLSTDGGASWQQKLFVNDSTGASDVVVHPESPQTIYAAMWQRIRSPEVRRAGGRGSGVFRSTNGGSTWTRLTDGLPAQAENVGRIGLAISPSEPNVLYAIYADDPGEFMGLYRSGDGGETWGRTNDAALVNLFSDFGWYFGNVRVRPDNSNVVFALGVYLFRSTNGGQSWNNVGGGVHVDHHAMCFDPAQPFHILLGNDGGAYRSTNNGNSWTFLPGLPVNQFYAATVDAQHPLRRYGGTQDNGTLRTPTGASSDWQQILGGDGFYVLVDPANELRIYGEYQWGSLYRSEDGGSLFDWILNGVDGTERTNWSTPIAMSPDNPQVLYYGAERLYRTTNRGDVWTAISPDLTHGGGAGNLGFGTITTIDVSALNPQVIWVGTDDANVWVTTDRGATWQNRSAGLPQRWVTRVTADPFDANAAYVCISGFRNAEQDAHLFYTSHLGTSWQIISGDLPAGPLNDVIADPNFRQRLYAASDFGVFVSVDRGSHWSALDENVPRVPVLDLVLHNSARQLVAATYGRSMFALDLDSLVLNRPPVIVSYRPALLDTLPVPQTVLFSVTAQDPDTDSLSYAWTRNGNAAGTDSAVELSFTQIGVSERVTVVVSDGELSTEQEWDFVTGTSGLGEFPGVPESAALLSVYPNPFNSQASVEYRMVRAGPVDIAVFDLTGRRVTTLLNSWQPAGKGHMTWSASALASGTYFIRYSAREAQRTQKVFLIR